MIKAILILPGTLLFLVPALIVWLTRETPFAASFPPNSAVLWLAGLLFGAAGLTLMIWTVRLFVVAGGGGSVAPWDPIKNFIVLGPYRYMRNPMLTGAALILVAEALLLQSTPVLLWMIAFVVLHTIYFATWEEPQLENRFGDAYRDYKRHVPRWIPHSSPYMGANQE